MIAVGFFVGAVFFGLDEVALGSCAAVVPSIESHKDWNESSPAKRMSAEIKILLLANRDLISSLSKLKADDLNVSRLQNNRVLPIRDEHSPFEYGGYVSSVSREY